METSVTIELKGRIDSNNSAETEKEIFAKLEGKEGSSVILDAEELEYISSAGLRVILHVRKEFPDLKVINVNSDVYEIFDMTGFTEMITIEKAYKRMSIEGCEVIGKGAKGTVYRVDSDNVVKVYNDANALEAIQHEREVAKLALILGIPTAISYDVVRVGDSFGSVFELLNARSFSKIIAEEPDKMDWCVKEYVDMLRLIHSTVVPEGKLPDMKDTTIMWAEYTKDYLPEDCGKKLLKLVNDVPRTDHMVHADYHTGNLELVGDEVLIIDMDTLAVGDPVYELAAMYNGFIGFSEYDHNVVKEFQGFDFETSKAFWHKTLAAYLETEDEARIKEVEDKARVLSYARLIRRSIRRGGLEDEKSKAEIELWKKELIELLGKVDSLTFDTPKAEGNSSLKELDIEAVNANMYKVIDFVTGLAKAGGASPKVLMDLELVVEEIFVNIANYAYAPGTGRAVITAELSEDPKAITVVFSDSGIKYDPLANEDPDITLPAEERPVGGLGVFLVKKLMDEASYEYSDGKNKLTVKKLF